VLALVIANINKDVEERLEPGPPRAELALFVFVLDSAEQIKEEGVVFDVVLFSDLRHGQGLEHRRVFRQILVVGVVGVVLYEF
jgi:hypothetical protein